MDEETGELFWFELLESSGIREVDQLTEKILSTLRFTPDSTFKSIDGYLHFVGLIPDFHDRADFQYSFFALFELDLDCRAGHLDLFPLSDKAADFFSA